MAGTPLNPRSFLFTLYGDYVQPAGGRAVPVSALVRAAAELGVTGNALRSALSRMSREGWFEPSRGPGERPGYRLSPRGRALIAEGTARIYGEHRAAWDGRWLMVAYRVPERRRGERDRLRQGLLFMGFGSLGNGIFASPRDLRTEASELVRRYGAEDLVTMHLGSLEWPADPAAVVARAWDLALVAARYAEFARRVRRDLRKLPGSDAEAFQRRFLLTHEFRRFQFADPDLPDALLPAGWIGIRARELFFELNAALRKPAERHWHLIASNDTIVDNGVRTAAGGGG